MSKLKGKWKALLVLNYLSAAVWGIMLLTYILIFWRKEAGWLEEKEGVVVVTIGGVTLILFNIFYIYVLKVFFPVVRLRGLAKFFYFAGLVFVGILAILFAFLVFVSSLDLFSNNNTEVYTLVTLIFSFIFTIINSLIVIWHFQLIDILDRNSRERLESVLNSIGVNENSHAE